MDSKNEQVSVVFRFKTLDKLQAFTLEREVMNGYFSEHPNGRGFVGYVPLCEISIQEINDFFVRQHIAIKECDILITLPTEPAMKSLKVPLIVNQMLKYIDCSLSCTTTDKQP